MKSFPKTWGVTYYRIIK